MFSPFGRPRPNASTFGSFQSRPTTTTPQPASMNPMNSTYQAQYKPDLNPSDQTGLPRSARQTPPEPAAQTRGTITSNYERARAELANPELFGGPMTEKQSRDLNWQKREDPIGYRDQALLNQKMYGTPLRQAPTPQTPSRPTNFNGPRPRFTP